MGMDTSIVPFPLITATLERVLHLSKKAAPR